MPDESPYHIGIDARLCGNQHAGIGRYIQNLIVNLLQDPRSKKYQWTFFFHEQSQIDELLLLKNNPKNIATIITPIRHYSLQEQLQLPHLFAKEELDLLHVPHFNIPLRYSGPYIVTIHDLLWHEYRGSHVTTLPHWKYYLKYIGYRHVASQAIANAEKVIVPAKTIRDTIVRYYPEAEEKIIVTYEGGHLEKTQKTENVGASSSSVSQSTESQISNTNTKYLLYIGSLYPHKNIEIILQALPQLPKYELWIVGSRNVFQDDVKKKADELGLSNQVKFLGFKTDAELKPLLANAHALVQPSLFEGFGLTGIEAMSAGTPVIASDIPVFSEVYQNGALFFDPKSSEEFVEKVKVFENKEERERRIKIGKEVASFYSWEAMAQQTMDVYEQVFSEYE